MKKQGMGEPLSPIPFTKQQLPHKIYMKKYFLSATVLATLGFASASAQDIYKVELLSQTDVTGDARYVGMGGAMNALGANLTALGTNPATGGLYRRNDIAVTAGFVQTPYNGTLETGPSKSRATFDQAGFVYSCDLGNSTGVKFVNMGFNYHKSRNFKNYIGLNNVALPKVMDNGVPTGMSQTWVFQDLATNLNGYLLDLGYDEDRESTTPAAVLAYDTYLIDAVDENGVSVGDRNVKIDRYVASDANRYNYNRAQWGGIEDYDFNLSMNINERVYLGATMTIHNVNMHSALLYDEELFQNSNVNDTGVYTMYQEEALTGVGYDGKFGMIVRPFDENPFRFGLAISTPTAYDLESRNYLEMDTPYADDKGHDRSFGNVDLNNEYRIRTPWKLNISAATTIGTRLALDAEYEWQSCSSAAVRYKDHSGYYNENGLGFKTDKYLQGEINAFYKNVHTFRVGAEARLSKEFSLRAGYNYVTAALDKSAYLNQFLDGSSYYYATNTDYVNPGPTNRITVGLGYHHKAFYMDAAYQHTMQSVDVYPFHYNLNDRLGAKNDVPGQSVDLNRNHFVVTMGFKF